MKVSLLTMSVDGGAGGATHHLHDALRKSGVPCQTLVQTKRGDVTDEAIVVVPRKRLVNILRRIGTLVHDGELDYLPLKLYPRRDSTIFSVQWCPDSISSHIAKFDPDLINLHWVCGGFVRIESISQFKVPVVWTLHDMWPFTGDAITAKSAPGTWRRAVDVLDLVVIKIGTSLVWYGSVNQRPGKTLKSLLSPRARGWLGVPDLALSSRISGSM